MAELQIFLATCHGHHGPFSNLVGVKWQQHTQGQEYIQEGNDKCLVVDLDHRVKFLKTFEFGAQRREGYRGESALLCSQFQTQF